MHSHSFLRNDRYSAKKTIKPVAFVCWAPDANTVNIMGDFNDWEPSSHPMKRQPDGAWRLEVPMAMGTITTCSWSMASRCSIPGRRERRAAIVEKKSH